MPMKIAFGSVCGLLTGVTLMIAINDGAPNRESVQYLLPLAVRLFPLICIALVATEALRRWISVQDDRTRQDAAALAEQRRCFRAEMTAAQADLRSRERELQLATAATQEYTGQLLGELHEARIELEQMRASHQTLRAENDEINNNLNETVQQLLQERANMFASRIPTSRFSTSPQSLACSPTRQLVNDMAGEHQSTADKASNYVP